MPKKCCLWKYNVFNQQHLNFIKKTMLDIVFFIGHLMVSFKRGVSTRNAN